MGAQQPSAQEPMPEPMQEPSQEHAPVPFEGRAAFTEALRQALLQACAEGRRDLFCLDADFVAWPWSDAELLAALTDWARPPRRLHLLAWQFDDLRRSHPRFVQWRTTWGHCVLARACPPDGGTVGALLGAAPAQVALGLASGFLAGTVAQAVVSPLSVRLFDKQAWRGAVSLQSRDAVRMREQFDALAQRSNESFAATTLGL